MAGSFRSLFNKGAVYWDPIAYRVLSKKIGIHNANDSEKISLLVFVWNSNYYFLWIEIHYFFHLIQNNLCVLFLIAEQLLEKYILLTMTSFRTTFHTRLENASSNNSENLWGLRIFFPELLIFKRHRLERASNGIILSTNSRFFAIKILLILLFFQNVPFKNPSKSPFWSKFCTDAIK